MLFLGASTLCGGAPSLNVFLSVRALQGIGGAMMSTAAYGLIPAMVPEPLRGRIFGILSVAAALGISVGGSWGRDFDWDGVLALDLFRERAVGDLKSHGGGAQRPETDVKGGSL